MSPWRAPWARGVVLTTRSRDRSSEDAPGERSVLVPGLQNAPAGIGGGPCRSWHSGLSVSEAAAHAELIPDPPPGAPVRAGRPACLFSIRQFWA